MDAQESAPAEDHTVQTTRRRLCTCPAPPWRAVVTVVACLVVEATLGVTYTYGNMLPYVTSYLRNVTQDTSLDYGHMMWVSSSRQLVHSAAVPLLGLIAARTPMRLYIFVGIAINAASFFGTFGAVQTSFVLMVIVHGVVQAISQAMLFPACVSIALQWFPDRKGLAGGITMSGFGGGAFIWNQVVTHWINPDNLQPDEAIGDHLYFTQREVLKNVPTVYLLLGGILTTIQVLCGLAIFIPPTTTTLEIDKTQQRNALCEDHETSISEGKHHPTPPGGEQRPKGGESNNSVQAPRVEPEEDPLLQTDEDLRKRNGKSEEGSKMAEGAGTTTDRQNKTTEDANISVTDENGKVVAPMAMDDEKLDNASSTEESKCPDYTPLQIVTSRATWILWLNSLASDYCAIVVFAFYKTYGQTFVHNDHFLSIVGSFGSVFNAGMRPLWGLLADWVGFLPTLALSQGVQAILLATFFTCELTASPAMYFIWVCALYGSICGIYALQGPVVSSMFGPRYLIFSLGLVYSSTGLVSNLTAVPISKAILASFSWKEIFFLAAALVAFAIVLLGGFLVDCGYPYPPHMRPGLLRHRFWLRRRNRSKGDSPDDGTAAMEKKSAIPLI